MRRSPTWLRCSGRPGPIAGAVLLLVATPEIAASEMFTGHFDPIDVGDPAGSIATAELNEDGVADLVVVKSSAGSVALFLGHGDGTFGPRTERRVGLDPYGLAIQDLDADGHQDLAVTNLGSNTVSVLRGNGDGTFSTRADFPTGRHPTSVASSDVNGDGELDLVTANSDLNTVSVLLGNGDATFAPKSDVVVGWFPHGVAISDLTGDGVADLAVINNQYGVSVLRGNGDGTFAGRVDYPTLATPFTLTVADLNADSRADLIVGYFSLDDVSVFLGTANGMFASRVDYNAGHDASGIAVGDLNADGKQDLAVGTLDEVAVLFGNGDGTFGTARRFVSASGGGSVVIADFDADGTQDLAATGYGVSILRGNGDGTFGPDGLDFDAGIGPSAVATTDLNGDGRVDVVAANSSNIAGTVSVLLGNGDGTLGPKRQFAVGIYAQSIAAADLNRDGKQDLAVGYSWVGGGVSVLLGNGDGTLTTRAYYPTGLAYSLAVGDLNGDSNPDLVIPGSSTGGPQVSLLFGNGDGTFAPETSVQVDSMPTSVALADLNGDGSLDLAVACPKDSVVSVLLGNGDGSFQTRYRLPVAAPGPLAIGNLDSDAQPDLAVLGDDNVPFPSSYHFHEEHFVSFFRGNGNGTFGPGTRYATGRFPRSVAIGDVDGDGHADLVTPNQDGNSVSVLLGDGFGGFAPRIDFGVGVYPVFSALADLNGDGALDIVTASFYGMVTVLENRRQPTDVAWDALERTQLWLQQPFESASGAVVIRYRVAQSLFRARVCVYDVRGREVWGALGDRGEQRLLWDRRDHTGSRAARGVYLVRLAAGDASASRKVVLLRP